MALYPSASRSIIGRSFGVHIAVSLNQCLQHLRLVLCDINTYFVERVLHMKTVSQSWFRQLQPVTRDDRDCRVKDALQSAEACVLFHVVRLFGVDKDHGG